LLAISIAMAVRRCNTVRIDQWRNSGLLKKPLNATIRKLLPLYRPGGRQGDSKKNDDAKYPPFAGHFDGRGGAPVLYCAHQPMEVVRGFPKSH
jgi:hypothetical protein